MSVTLGWADTKLEVDDKHALCYDDGVLAAVIVVNEHGRLMLFTPEQYVKWHLSTRY